MNKSWWLLAACGLLEAVCSGMNFFMQKSDSGYLALRTEMHIQTAAGMGVLLLLAGICTAAAGMWNFRLAKGWPLILNGGASIALGWMLAFWTHRAVAFRSIAVLIVLMAIGLGLFAFLNWTSDASRLMRRLALGAGVIQFGFACLFLAFVAQWVRLAPGSLMESLDLLGAYFGFSALCMLGFSIDAYRPRARNHGALGSTLPAH